jgi:glycosyltransferase involved in cell wall biosynthesis
MTLYLVYPAAEKIYTPDVIGFTLSRALQTRYALRLHDWDKADTIIPEPGDILLGHAHPDPSTVFRRSMANPNWRRIILMQPFNSDPFQVAFLDDIVPQCDWFLAITGKYWIDRLPQSPFSRWRPKIIHLDLAVDRTSFPFLKASYSHPGCRKYLYIGHTAPYKNTSYLEMLASAFGVNRFGTVGCALAGIPSHGWLDFSTDTARAIINQYDFLLMTSSADANPTTVLEAMSWGLIPIVTPECGYHDEPGIINIPLGDAEVALWKLRYADQLSDATLRTLARINLQRLDEHYNWDRFCAQVIATIERPDRGGRVRIPLAHKGKTFLRTLLPAGTRRRLRSMTSRRRAHIYPDAG